MRSAAALQSTHLSELQSMTKGLLPSPYISLHDRADLR
jgi:hypothetical protein